MNSKILTLLLAISGMHLLTAQQPLIGNVYNREQTSLDGYWQYIVDPYENGYYNYRYEAFDKQSQPGKAAFFTNSKREGKADLVEYDFDKMDSLTVPGDWNTQKEKLYYYEGTVWLKKSFDYVKKDDHHRVFVYFEACNYQAEVYLNGKKLGVHVGGFTPFNFEVTDLLKAKDNFLVVKADNKRRKDGVPTLNTDWWNYGGLTRGVKLVETAETYIRDYTLHLDPDNEDQIVGYVQLDGQVVSKMQVTIRIPDMGLELTMQTDQEGRARINIPGKGLKRWSTADPHLYDVELAVGSETVTDQIGFRTISTRGADILLNGQPVFLRGISIHEESPTGAGRGHTISDARQLLEWAQELGCDYVRLAHYPHNEHMVRLADKMGILVWEENPVYWTIDWANEGTFQNAKQQLTELIDRDKNRASVIIWSMANETPTSDARNRFLSKLAAYARAKDPTRLISAALEQSDYKGNPLVRTIDDPFAAEVDVLSFNQYIGWYDGGIEKCQTISWQIDMDKPVVISEFGAGAKYGLHGDRDDRWTEEYQAYLYKQTVQMVDPIKQLRGISPWILVDFRSPRRVLPEIQDGWNRKGLISETGERKQAFYVLQNYYKAKEKAGQKK